MFRTFLILELLELSETFEKFGIADGAVSPSSRVEIINLIDFLLNFLLIIFFLNELIRTDSFELIRLN